MSAAGTTARRSSARSTQDQTILRRGPLASFRQRHGAPPALVRLRATVIAALALIPAAIGAALFDQAAGGLESDLDFVCTFAGACIGVWFLMLALTTGAAWAQQDAPREEPEEYDTAG